MEKWTKEVTSSKNIWANELTWMISKLICNRRRHIFDTYDMIEEKTNIQMKNFLHNSHIISKYIINLFFGSPSIVNNYFCRFYLYMYNEKKNKNVYGYFDLNDGSHKINRHWNWNPLFFWNRKNKEDFTWQLLLVVWTFVEKWFFNLLL